MLVYMQAYATAIRIDTTNTRPIITAIFLLFSYGPSFNTIDVVTDTCQLQSNQAVCHFAKQFNK